MGYSQQLNLHLKYPTTLRHANLPDFERVCYWYKSDLERQEDKDLHIADTSGCSYLRDTNFLPPNVSTTLSCREPCNPATF